MKYGIIVENLCDWTLCKGENYDVFVLKLEVVRTTLHSSYMKGSTIYVEENEIRFISKKEYEEVLKTNFYRFNKLVVDFDCTLASNPRKWPSVGKQKLIHKLVALYVNHKKKQGWIIILNTMREKEKGLDDAVQFCKDHNIHIDLVNENLQSDIDKFGDSRKIGCTRSIDDTQVGLIGWLLRTFS